MVLVQFGFDMAIRRLSLTPVGWRVRAREPWRLLAYYFASLLFSKHIINSTQGVVRVQATGVVVLD